ncbi:hypothetical protein NQ315_010309 [Exocentrus adspersus]|uniref:FAM193 C-terminal domain-containing protein n=1 Tax=Exocentrus adspersus TaxID=1586481 RepID=A0AAV8WAZ8_9CUCU|nr:hypothetical protein NQ315_010309 [Exocentrus adspersus]
MGSKQSKSTEESSGIYSLEFLKSLYDKPRDNIHKLLQIPGNNTRNISINGLNLLNNSEVTRDDKKVLLDFLLRIKDMSPPKAQQWIDLQHYLHYVYRNFANADPDPSAEVLSAYFINDIKGLVKSLIQEDASQLYLRVIALLREYCIFAQWNYTKSDGEHTITKLFYYYEAMLSAAKNLSAVFSDLEVIIYKNYSVCWIDFNTCVFIRYFFETEYVQNKIYQCLETRVSPGDTPAMFGLLEDLKNLWVKEQKRLDKINEDAALDRESEAYKIEEVMVAQHKKVLSNNFWIQRPKQELKSLKLGRFDHQIFTLLGDPTFHPAGPILDRNGQCICEECLIAKYKCILDLNQEQLSERVIKNSQRLTYCRRCLNLVDLDYFHQHINSHNESDSNDNKPQLNCSNLSRIISDKIDFVKLGNGSPNLSNALTEKPADKQFSSVTKEPLPKLASEPPVFKNTCDIHFSKSNGELKNDMDSTKVAFEEFLKHRKENMNKSEQILNKNVSLSVCHLRRNGQKKCESTPRDNNIKIRDIKKNGHKYEKPYPLSCKTGTTPKPACEHNCKQEEEAKATFCQNHNATCDHHKETKKCDCTYCEVFGTSVMSHTHKSNELRDRLRIRLHQRREKRTKDNCKTQSSAAAAAATANSMKLKSVINKVEERVPLPSSPTNIPPAPSVKSSDSSLNTSSATDDIHGLVNYIEGNTALNKMELAQKKAAKKARQRLKKEEERIKEEEQRRLAEEMKKKEAEKKRKELAKKLAEAERIKHALQAKSDGKKKGKKDQQPDKRQPAKQDKSQKKEPEKKSQVLEETIPAMVTIKRVADNGSSAPTVTITLKGSTPDQDKLLYTLVNGADEKTADKTPEASNQNAASKKKKKKQQNQAAPTVITKELKVTLELDSKKTSSNQETKKANKNSAKDSESKKATTKQIISKKDDKSQDDLQIPLLRLPPGITITKVEGPISNRCYQVGNMEDQKGSAINVGKSGVIVVDTEKLIQNKQNTEATQGKGAKGSKKSRKKKNKKQVEVPVSPNAQSSISANKKMITLKNPIFQSFQPKPEPPVIDRNSDGCGPAAIFTNENGMVTIRSSRLQQSMANGGVLNSMPVLPMSKLLPEVQKSKQTSNCFMPNHHVMEEKNEIMSPFNAQEILSGLPGIEITKVDKKAIKTDMESNKSCQTAQVSIIPASNSGEKFNFDKDDWLYDSVFTPKDVLEDDLDAEELELEAFKRFCQQSIPPPRKEKVAHLNVADIVLKKKTDRLDSFIEQLHFDRRVLAKILY